MATKLKTDEAMNSFAQAVPADIPAIPGDQDPPSPKPDKPPKNLHAVPAKLKIVEEVADIVAPPHIDAFTPAPSRKRHAGWTATRQRKFIEHLALTGNVGEACALVGVASSSAYRLRNRAGAEGFARAWDSALRLCATRLTAIMFDRAVNGRVERHYKDGELAIERRIPSDYLLTWMLARLDPLQFGSPSAKAFAAANGDPREAARMSLPNLLATFEDVAEDQCAFEPIDFLDERLGETATGDPIADDDRR